MMTLGKTGSGGLRQRGSPQTKDVRIQGVPKYALTMLFLWWEFAADSSPRGPENLLRSPKCSAISRCVFPLSTIALISGSNTRTCVYSRLLILILPDVVLFSYIRGDVVYCPFLLGWFSKLVRGLELSDGELFYPEQQISADTDPETAHLIRLIYTCDMEDRRVVLALVDALLNKKNAEKQS